MQDSVEKTVSELIDRINFMADLQRGKFGVLSKPKQVNDCIDEMKSSLANLSFIVKYLIFDLEATKRENISLKKLLDNKDQK